MVPCGFPLNPAKKGVTNSKQDSRWKQKAVEGRVIFGGTGPLQTGGVAFGPAIARVSFGQGNQLAGIQGEPGIQQDSS